MTGTTTTLQITITSLILLAPLSALAQHGGGGGAHRIPGPPPGPMGIEVPSEGTRLPMLDFGGRPVVEVRINGKGPYRFILDTGARINLIDEALNEELRLPLAEGMAAAPRDGYTPQIVSMREIRVGNLAIRGVIGATIPLEKLLGAKAPRGVLSAANFPGYLLTLDYPGKRISITKGTLDRADSRSVFEYSASDALPTLPIQVAGHAARVHLDTGSPAGLTLPTKFLEELPLASEPKQAGKTRTYSGEYPVSRAAVNGAVELGEHQLKLTEIDFSDVRPAPGAQGPGNIGSQVLRNFVVTLDWRSRRIRLTQ